MSDTRIHKIRHYNKVRRITVRFSDDDLKKLEELKKAHAWFRPPVSEIIRNCVKKCYNDKFISIGIPGMSDK